MRKSLDLDGHAGFDRQRRRQIGGEVSPENRFRRRVQRGVGLAAWIDCGAESSARQSCILLAHLKCGAYPMSADGVNPVNSRAGIKPRPRPKGMLAPFGNPI